MPIDRTKLNLKHPVFAILLFLYSFSSVFGFSHQEEADSLYRALTLADTPTKRLEILSKLVREVHYSDSAQPYYLEAIELARSLKNTQLLAQHLVRLGVYYRNNNLQDEALALYEEALEISQQANNPSEIGHALNSIGQIFYYKKLFEESLNYYEEAGEYFKKAEDMEGLGYNLTGKSLVLGELGKYLQAIETIDAAIAIRSSTGNERQLIVSRFNKAQLLLDMGAYESAEKDILTLYEYGLKNDKLRAIQALEKLVEIGFKNEYFPKVQEYTDIALQLHAEKPNRESIIPLLEMAIKTAELQNNEDRKAYLSAILEAEQRLFDSQTTKEYLAKMTIQRQKREIEALNRENELILKTERFEKYIFLLFIALTIILSFVVISYKRYLNYQRDLNQRLKVQKIKMEIQAQELAKTNQVKDKILSILSHDLRGPLHSLEGMLDLVNSQSLTQEEFEKYIPELSVNLGNNILLLENLLLWSKNQMQGMQTKKTSFDFALMVDKNFEIIQLSSNFKNQNLQNLVANDTYILADRNMVEIVLRNLLNNAVKFTLPGDTVSVNVEEHGTHYQISVADTGVGMSHEVKNKLFKNDFYTTLGTNREGGTGLGLMISKELVEYNKGKIWVESEPSMGSKFIFTIPKN
jgi:two-component system, sensor histidine kinase and response regulator